MMVDLQLKSIGTIEHDGGDTRLVLDKAYAQALTGLDGFSHIQVLWWFSGCDCAADRAARTEQKPYRHGPRVLGTFATRSPRRPNPIALDCAQVTYIDHKHAVIGLAYSEAYAGSPVLDIKPYTPGIDRVESPAVPEWCGHWPKCYEASAGFDWEGEMNG